MKIKVTLQHEVRSTGQSERVFFVKKHFANILTFENMVGTVVTTITLYQCGLGSILGLDAICGLSLLVLGCERFFPQYSAFSFD